MARPLTRWQRGAAGALLVVMVVGLHGAATRWIAGHLQVIEAGNAPPPRLAVAFVRELRPAAPPLARPAPAAAPPRRARRAAAAPPPAPAASQPAVSPPGASQPEATALADVAEPPIAPPAEAETADTPASGEPAVPPQAAAASAPAADWPAQWPASTRLSYVLTGWFRGELHGEASVEWIRSGRDYQVHLDVSIGPSFAPLMRRSMSSAGELAADGLRPRRYDEQTRVGFAAPRRIAIRFEPDAVWLPGERRRERWPGMQDAASQFVHLTYLFTTQPERLAPGQRIEVSLALPRTTDRWVYDVREAEPLRLPFGTVPVLHLQPRRLMRPGGDLVMEAWFAPSLLYLPVRIRIHQDAQTWLDLLIDRPPMQAGG
jgi:hypothetical protein